MRSATCLTLLATGAIATFAVHLPATPVNMQVVGVIIMMTGIAGLFLPERTTGWLRRRIVVHGDLRDGDPASGPGGDGEDEQPYAAYYWQDPAVLAAQVLSDAERAARRPGSWSRSQPPGRWPPGARQPGQRPAGALGSGRLASVQPQDDERRTGTG